MPSQLRRRLASFVDPRVAVDVNAVENVVREDNVPQPAPETLTDKNQPPPRNTRHHWKAGGFGSVMGAVECVTIHGTSGWPSYHNADHYADLYRSINKWVFSEGRWKDFSAIGTQYFLEPNGNIYPLIGPENLVGRPRSTGHNHNMNAVSLGIENADNGNDSNVSQNSSLFRRFHNVVPLPNVDDLAGMRLYGLLHPNYAPDLNLVWFAQTATYAGPGDLDERVARYGNWNNSLFSERHYRSLALFCRFLAEEHGIPRNFPLLPYLSSSTSVTDATNATFFRQMVLADPNADQIARKVGIPIGVIRTGGAAFASAYAASPRVFWNRFFDRNAGATGPATVSTFRGFISHLINGAHACPGPLFDWHRFAREMWDWWWYPFDLTRPTGAVFPVPATTRRAYVAPRRSTPLIEYYFDAAGLDEDYDRLKPQSLTAERFAIPAETPVYALANGIAVAAKQAITSGPAAPGFLLVRHDVYHATGTGDRISYDQQPTFVWSLITYLTNFVSTEQIGTGNPDWVNRMVIRLTECERAILYRIGHSTDDLLKAAWIRPPIRGGSRLAVGAQIELDGREYRRMADDLRNGKPVLFPREADATTPVRILLGDYLGTPGTPPGMASGIQVEIFSTSKLDDVPGVQRMAVSAAGTPWWRSVSSAARGEALVDQDLPADGMVWRYPMTSFLRWLNAKTWASEWPKYGALNVSGPTPVPAARPARPPSRINF